VPKVSASLTDDPVTRVLVELAMKEGQSIVKSVKAHIIIAHWDHKHESILSHTHPRAIY
jgi:hypothetical protein